MQVATMLGDVDRGLTGKVVTNVCYFRMDAGVILKAYKWNVHRLA